MDRTRRLPVRGTWLIAGIALAAVTVGCQDTTGDGKDAGRTPAAPSTSSKTPGGAKDSAVPTPGTPKKPDSSASATELTCDQLRNAELQNASLRLPDAPEGTIAFTDGRWEGDGVVIELQPQCDIGDMTGDPAADAVAAVKVTAGGTGRFYGLVTWRNDGGVPVPAAAASLGDRTPVVSISISPPPTKRATVVYLTRGDSDPAAVVTIRRTSVYRVVEPAMIELHHSDTPHTP
ncbi:hypothetical protein I3F58_12425 [Streptomyces sp. MUM 203J]|uniref:hypothetical protein n=1 Tax=Streptomyces sp. MUM 203J TaxID=2791990 RepID=UPI001F04FBFD|nr:hypothetical protein [Streptomyces sp. MUM 203J]MCH0540360.1 hypothetical protein [Streptomyces sp. MUM 203J]